MGWWGERNEVVPDRAHGPELAKAGFESDVLFSLMTLKMFEIFIIIINNSSTSNNIKWTVVVTKLCTDKSVD